MNTPSPAPGKKPNRSSYANLGSQTKFQASQPRIVEVDEDSQLSPADPGMLRGK